MSEKTHRGKNYNRLYVSNNAARKWGATSKKHWKKKKNCQLRIVYPVEIPSKTEGERKLLNV